MGNVRFTSGIYTGKAISGESPSIQSTLLFTIEVFDLFWLGLQPFQKNSLFDNSGQILALWLEFGRISFVYNWFNGCVLLSSFYEENAEIECFGSCVCIIVFFRWVEKAESHQKRWTKVRWNHLFWWERKRPKNLSGAICSSGKLWSIAVFYTAWYYRKHNRK